MSEFSESYHLKTDSSKDAAALLGRAGRKGFVFPPTNGWVTFLAEGSTFEPDARLIAANQGFLLHYTSAEDHGWSFAFFETERQVCAYRCDWEEDIHIGDTDYVPAVLEAIVAEHSTTTLTEMEALLRPASIEEVFESDAPRRFAAALELEHFEWLSFDYVTRDRQREPGSYVEAVLVG